MKNQALRSHSLSDFLSFHLLMNVYQSLSELAASVVCHISSQSSTNDPFVLLFRGSWGLFSGSWKEEVKPNDLGMCVVWGKDVPAKWRWLQPGPAGLGEICQIPFLNPADGKGLLNRTFHQHLAATKFHFAVFYSTWFKNETSHPTKTQPVWNANLRMGRRALP